MARILIVEDNEMNLDMLSRRLERRGHQIVAARDGQAGIDAAKREQPDLVLMDMSLPEVDGWEATRRLRAERETKTLPIIALTAHAVSGDREKCIEAGCDDYDTKPVQFDRLIAKIDAQLDRARAMKAQVNPAVVTAPNALETPDSSLSAYDPPPEDEPLVEPVDDRARPATILVVDDGEMNRDLLARRLQKSGYAVVTARDGEEALELLGSMAHPFDLVLLDIMMPGLDGYQVLARMKSDERLRHLPVIMISALDEIASVVKCIELGAEDYLPKPFDPVLLKARIESSLERKRWHDREREYLARIEEERRRADDLLHVILPAAVVQELKSSNSVQPRRHEDVAVLFCDIVGFTAYCDRTEPTDVLHNLQPLFEAYEDLSLRHGLQKIKTIGDAYMATAGLLTATENPVLDCVRCGLDMVRAADTIGVGWTVRVGVHVGPVVAGVIGRRQYLFDIWGDTVNTASRIEGLGKPGEVNLSDEAWARVEPYCVGRWAGKVLAKGKGEIDVYTVETCIT